MEQFLENLKNWLQKQGEKHENRSAVWKWVTGIGLSFIAVLASAILYYKLWKKSKELAKVNHEKDVIEKKKQLAVMKQELVKKDKVINSKSLNIVKYEKELKAKKAELEELDKEKDRIVQSLNQINNWKDLDNYLKNK